MTPTHPRRSSPRRLAALRRIHAAARRHQWHHHIPTDIALAATGHAHPSLACYTDTQLEHVASTITAWEHVHRVLDTNGHLDADAIRRIATLPDWQIATHLTAIPPTERTTMTATDLTAAAQTLADTLTKTTRIVHLSGDNTRYSEDHIIHTGSLGLDMAIGVGGIPRGCVAEIYGEESSGKSTLMQTVAGQAQRAGMIVLYLDAEYSIEPVYARRCGMDTDHALINYPGSLEEAFNTMRETMKFAAADDTPDVLIIVDSVPALPSVQYTDADATTDRMRSPAARAWAEWMPTLVRDAGESGTTLLLVNQTRARDDKYTSLASTTPGGKAIKFAATLRLEVSSKPDHVANTSQPSPGRQTKVKVTKNKAGSPGRVATYYLYSGQGIYWAATVWDAAVEAGIVSRDVHYTADGTPEQKKNWYSIDVTDPHLLEAARAETIDPATGEAGDEDPVEQLGEKMVIQTYHNGPACEKVLRHPTLVDALAEATLDTLNNN